MRPSAGPDLAAADELYLPDLIAAETVYVLESYYEIERDQIAEAMRSLIAFDAIVTVDPALLLRRWGERLTLSPTTSKSRCA